MVICIEVAAFIYQSRTFTYTSSLATRGALPGVVTHSPSVLRGDALPLTLISLTEWDREWLVWGCVVTGGAKG